MSLCTSTSTPLCGQEKRCPPYILDTREVSSKTMESLKAPGLYFIGEVLDVSGHLGGFNFQWAWASAYAAAQYV